jgi:hypothetical protein
MVLYPEGRNTAMRTSNLALTLFVASDVRNADVFRTCRFGCQNSVRKHEVWHPEQPVGKYLGELRRYTTAKVYIQCHLAFSSTASHPRSVCVPASCQVIAGLTF